MDDDKGEKEDERPAAVSGFSLLTKFPDVVGAVTPVAPEVISLFY